MAKSSLCALLIIGLTVLNVESFSPLSQSSTSCSQRLFLSAGNEPEPKKGFFSGFFEELDAFVDDAMGRRLGAGSAFYGKRKSNFYGSDDKNKKADRNAFDALEDYQGPSQAGYFKWMQDEDGQMRPVTRMKEKVVERRTARK